MQKSSFFFFIILAYSLALHTLSAESSCNAQGNEICTLESRVHRLSVSHREGGGIGYNQGYSSLDAFFSLPSKWDMAPFLDFRAHVFNDGKWAANAGLGIRKQLSNSSWIIGGNAFYDFRHASHTSFNQIGIGLELLGTAWDFHGNAYIPVRHNRRNYANPFRGFEGHSAFFTGKYECAFAGADVLAGRELWSCDDYLIRGALGAYFLKGHFNKKAGGGLFKVTAEITHYVHIEGQLSYDNVFKWRPQGELRINIPIGKKVKLNRCNLSCNSQEILSRALVSPVDRFEIIAKKNRKKKVIALDPVSGQPLNFIFVDNLRGHSDGSFENPFATLLEAQIGSRPNDIIYVFPGDGTSNGMNAGITLQQGQYFIGSSVAFQVSIKGKGHVAIPPQSSISPSISHQGDTITLANDNTISGFNIISSSGNGIVGGGSMPGGVGVANVTISNNQFYADLNCIFIRNISGFINISNNQDNGYTNAFGIATLGISLSTNTSGSSIISIADNNFIISNNDNIAFTANGTHQSNITIESNIFSQAPNQGIFFNLLDSTITNGLIFNNTFDQCSVGSYIFSTANAVGNMALIGNIVDQSQHEGILFGTAANSILNLNIMSNTVSQNNISGDGSSGITITNASTPQITVRMINNSSFPNPTNNAVGYEFDNSGGLFLVQSPDLTLSGVQSINSGIFPIKTPFTGPITFIPLAPP